MSDTQSISLSLLANVSKLASLKQMKRFNALYANWEKGDAMKFPQ
ncbi:MAG: hypothetical protein U9N57_11680 [Pseudomonadota bacterium]|nr:hypothetical protein [Pseudomonadota bacterium]